MNEQDRKEIDNIVKSLIIENAQELKKYTFSWHLVERMDKMVDVLGALRNHGF